MPRDFVEGKLTPEAKAKLRKLQRMDGFPPLRKRMTIATSPVVPAVKRAARSIPSTHSRYKAAERGGSLRSAVAGSIQRKIQVSRKSFVVLIKQVPKGGKSNLASVLEGTKPWVHPTYGHDPVVTQEPHPFFFDTIEKIRPTIEREMNKVLDDIDRELM